MLAAAGFALHGLDVWLSASGAPGFWRAAGSLGWLAWAGAAQIALGDAGRVGPRAAGGRDRAGPRVARAGGWLLALAVVALGEIMRHGSLADTPSDAEARMRAVAEGAPLLAMTVFAVAPAVGEELFFRGPLLRGLARLHGPVVAWALSAGSFAIVHPGHGLAAAIFGAALAGLALATGRSREAVVAHALHNLLGLRMLGI